MVITEFYRTREDGVVLTRTYSNKNKYIIQNGTGIKYAEAIDPQNMYRTYTESTEDIPAEEEEPQEETR